MGGFPRVFLTRRLLREMPGVIFTETQIAALAYFEVITPDLCALLTWPGKVYFL